MRTTVCRYAIRLRDGLSRPEGGALLLKLLQLLELLNSLCIVTVQA